MQTHPTIEQVMALPPVWKDDVQPDWIDVNGHMNIRHYVDLGGLSTGVLCAELGVDDDYRNRRRLGLFTAEQHLTYLREMRLGTRITVHVRVLARSQKACHMIAFIVDRDLDQVACIFETLIVHVNMDTRRAAPFPQDIAAGLDRHIAADADVTWQAPTSGAIGIRGQ